MSINSYQASSCYEENGMAGYDVMVARLIAVFAEVAENE